VCLDGEGVRTQPRVHALKGSATFPTTVPPLIHSETLSRACKYSLLAHLIFGMNGPLSLFPAIAFHPRRSLAVARRVALPARPPFSAPLCTSAHVEHGLLFGSSGLRLLPASDLLHNLRPQLAG